MKKYKKILDRCKCGVYLTVNQHRDYYQSAEDKLKELSVLNSDLGIEDSVKAIMIKTNTIVELQFYPDTPVGCYTIYHYDIDTAIDMALEALGL